MTEAAGRLFRWTVDDADVIVDVDAEWLAFARENDAPGLTAEQVVGRPLFDFVTGPDTRQVLRELLARARLIRRPLAYPFRCDGPAARRLLTLTVEPLDGGGLRFESRLLRVEPRDAVPVPPAGPAIAGGEHVVAVCSWCKRVRVGERWFEIEHVVERLGLFERTPPPLLTHGMCADCITIWRGAEDTAP